MTEAAQEVVTHQTLIQEVFIDPIRTVVVIDDEFPTLDDLVLKERLKVEDRPPQDQDEIAAANRNWKPRDVLRVQEILRFARQKPRPWLVDVHDGNKVKTTAEEKIAPSLDHSDLMVLDYHLNGEDGGGEAAIKIIRRLAKNKNHNLVIVYTKGYAGDTDAVRREIALGLTRTDETLANFRDNTKQQIEGLLSEWEDEVPGITERLKEEVSSDAYLASRYTNGYSKFWRAPEGAQLQALMDTRPKALNPTFLMQWLFLQRQEQVADQLTTENLGEIKHGGTEECNWLKSENLFVTVISKTTSPTEFEAKLTNALRASFPSPHRLLVSKMRATISRQGSTAEAAILSNKPVQTAWLDDLLNPAPYDENSAILSTINRHWEALGDQLRENLQPFSTKLRQVFLPMGLDHVLKECGLDRSDLASKATILSYNQFISTKSFDRQHLTTGHIFSTSDKSKTEEGGLEYWICLTPACDMVPGQKRDKGWNARLETASPFNAFKLFPVTDSSASDSATTNNYVYFTVGGSPAAFSIYPANGSLQANPEWEQMFASDFARFSQEAKFSITKTTSVDGKLRLDASDAQVVAQLRSEYALNLLQRAGTYLSRPGLGMGFKSVPAIPKSSGKAPTPAVKED